MKKTHKLLIIILLITFGFFANAGEIQKHSLENGMTVFTLEDHSSPIVTFQVWYEVGSKNEPAGATGMSHLLEHMMFKGSKNYGPEEHSRLIAQNGGYDNAFTTSDFTGYYSVLPSDKLELALKLEADRMQNLLLNKEALKSERKVVMEERRYRTDNRNMGKINEQIWALSYQAHPYHHPTVGWMSDLEDISREEINNYYEQYYSPNNSTVIVVGDFETEKVKKLIKDYFGSMSAQPEPDRVNTREPKQRGERRLTYHKSTQTPYIVAGYHIPGKGHKDYYTLKVISALLSKGESSRLYKKLVYKDQSALFAGGWTGAREDHGLFLLYAAVKPGHTVKEVEKSLYEEVKKLKNKPVDKKELQKVKNQLQSENVFSLESIDGKASAVGRALLQSGDYRLYNKAPEKIKAVSREDIQKTAKKYFKKNTRNVVILKSKESESK